MFNLWGIRVKFKSLNTGQEITPAAYIAELMCERKAKIDNKGALPKSYWNLPKYTSFFKQQIVAASKLLKEYEPTPIIRVMDKNPRIYSLMVKWIKAAIDRENLSYQKEKESRKEVDVPILSDRKKVKEKKGNLFREL